MKVAIIGTVGVPANYGGFETLVEQLIRHNKSGIEYQVFCSSKSYETKTDNYHGAQLEYIGLQANGLQSIPYDIISLVKANRKSDTILILGVSGCSFLPIFRLFSKKKLIINIDGLEHKREKWNKWVRKFLKYSEKQAVKFGDIIVTDNQGITDYVTEEYGKNSELICYGGDHAITKVDDKFTDNVLAQYGITKDNYAIAVCRIEPENNVHVILEAFEKAKKKILFIGNWQKSEYGKKLQEKYKDSDYVKITPAVYELKVLNVLRGNCQLYLHGHSAGGTNPSLVEAMFFEKPIFAFDCIYNRETTENRAVYFKNSEELVEHLQSKDIVFPKIAADMKEIALRRYTWARIAQMYEKLF